MVSMKQRVGPLDQQRLGYQAHKYNAALEYVRPERRVAIDIGAHVGLWSWPMSFDFERVHAFEPMPEHRQCWRANMDQRGNAELHECALGETTGSVVVQTRTPGSSGDTGVNTAADAQGISADLRMLDSFNIQHIDFIKVDCEGYELFVLRGAIETLKRDKPCVIVEQKPETGMADRYGIGVTDGVEFLKSMGAVVRNTISGDYIMSWD
jgi:FkbM family methyltransferase